MISAIIVVYVGGIVYMHNTHEYKCGYEDGYDIHNNTVYSILNKYVHDSDMDSYTYSFTILLLKIRTFFARITLPVSSANIHIAAPFRS